MHRIFIVNYDIFVALQMSEENCRQDDNYPHNLYIHFITTKDVCVHKNNTATFKKSHKLAKSWLFSGGVAGGGAYVSSLAPWQGADRASINEKQVKNVCVDKDNIATPQKLHMLAKSWLLSGRIGGGMNIFHPWRRDKAQIVQVLTKIKTKMYM